jgi:hypothetical protein
MGFFNKKKEKTKQLPEEYLILIKKWDTFLEKIKTRFEESLVNAEEAILDNLNESNYDLSPTLQAWNGIKSQLSSLSDKIDETYDKKVLPQMLNYVKHYETIDQSIKGSNLRSVIYQRIERFEIVIEGKVSQRFYNHAVKELDKDFHCTQCSAKLNLKKDVFHAHYVSCDYCNTVNTFTPNDKIAQIRWVVDNIAKYDVISDWDQMTQAKDEFDQIRPPGEKQDNSEYINAFKKREETERQFWTNYFLARSEFLPLYKETIEHDVDNKMKWFYEERKRELDF